MVSEALLNQARKDIAKLLEAKVLEAEEAESFKTLQTQLKMDSETLLGVQTTRRDHVFWPENETCRRVIVPCGV